MKKFEMSGKYYTVIAACLGIMAFIVVYGVTSLNPCNDRWIMSGYDENDIIQHYSGWLAFRASQWSFPLGLADRMAVGDGTIISYTDSIPWLAVFFKLLSVIYLPETFQYFGIYVLICFILQGIASFHIIYYKTQSMLYSLLGEIFFCFSPILMERAFRHTALASHWLILFSILIYFQHNDNYKTIHYLCLQIIEILAIGIHPYFLPMVFCFSFLCVVKDIGRKEYFSIISLVIQLFVTYLSGVLLGVLGNSVNISRERYGFFSLNLNAVVNPTSAGGYTWSSFMDVKPQMLGNYDGFNYLGAGVILLLLFDGLILIRKPKIILKYVRDNLMLIMVMIVMTVFAITNVVTWNDKIIWQCELPNKIEYLCGIFRASGRMFYPVYYIIYFFSILMLWKYREELGHRKLYALFVLILCLQLFDLKNVINEKNIAMQEKQDYYSILCNDTLKNIAARSEYVCLDHCDSMTHGIAVWAFKNGIGTYFSTANSGEYPESMKTAKAIEYGACNEEKLGKNIIVTTDIATAIRYMQIQGIDGYYEDGVYFFYNNEHTKDRMYTLGEISLDMSVYNVALSNQTNDTLDSGVWIDGEKILCFNYSPDMLSVLQNSSCVINEGEQFYIKGIRSWDEWSIYVEVDHEAGACRYPAVLQLY